MPIGFAFLGDDLQGDGADFFKVFEGEIERFVVQDNHAAQRPVDILFDLVAVPWTLPQHGENQDFAIHMILPYMIQLSI
jgi:hypothetical protein